jgi:hypothetical protein
MNKGRIRKPGADRAAFFVKFGSLSTMNGLLPKLIIPSQKQG